MAINLYRYWCEALAGLGVAQCEWPNNVAQNISDEFHLINIKYADPVRRYHNLDHIQDCLINACAAYAHILKPIDYKPEILIALWYHDFVYDTRASVGTNELLSANAAVKFLRVCNVSTDSIAVIVNAIKSTMYCNEPETMAAKLVCDIDLSILGASEKEFNKYDKAIRYEYNWVGEQKYKDARKKILQSFLEKPRIYSTDYFHGLYEVQARINLTRTIERLK